MTVPFLGGRAYRDRIHAGRVLASQLAQYAGRDDVVVLGLPRGGVPVAHEVAAALGAPLDVLLVRKLGVPGHTELAMGAIGPGGVRVVNPTVVGPLGIPDEVVDAVAREEEAELARRQQLYRGDREPPAVAGKVAIVVDDGLATGATMRAAVSAVRGLGPARVVVAVPVGAGRTCRELEDVADEVVCARMPATFQAVGQWYADFAPTGDAEIRRLLSDATRGDEGSGLADDEP
ncbi:MAG TPA: phosphoribosyltransferase family protein [Acidimicrobiales bacterium]|nr:phosphoribosyltransferase family protein [Acidimicrobiales bacterium]